MATLNIIYTLTTFKRHVRQQDIKFTDKIMLSLFTFYTTTFSSTFDSREVGFTRSHCPVPDSWLSSILFCFTFFRSFRRARMAGTLVTVKPPRT